MNLIWLSSSRRGSFRKVGQASRRHANPAATIAISVDAGQTNAEAADSQRRLQTVSAALLDLLRELHLPATWGVSEPFLSPVVDRLCRNTGADPAHEIAIRLGSHWSSPGSRRALLAEGLARHARHARWRGVEISTMFVEPALVVGNDDLLVKRGITGIRRLATTAMQSLAARHSPRQLRYGLWEFPIAGSFPGNRSLAPTKIRRFFSLQRVMGARFGAHVLHVSVEIAQLTAGDRTAWRSVERNLQCVARMRAEEGLHVTTIQQLTRRWSSAPTAAPQRSILRRAA